jgi:hypothetical protein
VLLYWGSPVAYGRSGLDDELIAELQAWDIAYYDRVDADGQWRSVAAGDAHQIEGAGLAQRVADALGRSFAVELDERIFQSARPPASPTAPAAFKAHAGEQRAGMRRTMAMALEADREDCSGRDAPEVATQPGLWLREVRARTTKRVRVVLSPDDLVVFPVEVVVDGRPGYADADMLGISATLRQDLESFQQWWEQHAWDDDAGTAATVQPEWAQWRRQGIQLVQRLQAELGEDYFVTWN